MVDPTLHKLEERVKELTALHETARLLQDETRAPTEVMQDLVKLLPPAWQYPNITEARIRFNDIVVNTPGFVITDWMQTGQFTTRSGDAGTIEVCYRVERPHEVEGPFLAEERNLINSLAEMLRAYFQNILANREIQAARDNLEQLVQKRTEELQHTNRELAEEISQHRVARQHLDEHQNRLRQLSTELTLAEAKERREIAAEVHDHIGQGFVFIRMRLQQLRGDAVFSGFEKSIDEIIHLIDSAIQYTRRLTFEISTPILYELGLPAALEWLAEQYEQKHNLHVKVQIDSSIPATLPEAHRVLLFKSVQELLTNVVKYAKASAVSITMKRENGKTILSVRDDGIGFDIKQLETVHPDRGGFGLFSIRERLHYFGGEMTLDTKPGAGTIVTLVVL